MKRVPEPELMIKKEQVLSYSMADFSVGEENFINFIKNYLRVNNIRLSSQDLIVDLGCGPGNITEKLFIQWPEVNIIGIDGSKEMIYEAEAKKHENFKNVHKNLKYICADIKNIDLKDITSKGKISLLVSNSFIHHINKLDDFFYYLKQLSDKGTINFHKDLIRPADENSALKLRAKCSEIYNEVLTNDYYASLKASYRIIELKEKIFKMQLNSMDVIKDSDEYLIMYGKV